MLIKSAKSLILFDQNNFIYYKLLTLNISCLIGRLSNKKYSECIGLVNGNTCNIAKLPIFLPAIL